jgi:ABC-type polysaccharide/polyol phosphate export permease
MKEHIIVYESNQRAKLGFFHIWGLMFSNILKSRELIWQLFKRDFIGQYKKSFLGIAWFVVSPVIGILQWVFMNMTGVLNPGDVGIPYPAFVLLGTSIWGLFMGFYDAGLKTLQAGTGFIMQVNYPHEALLIKQVAQFLATFILGFLMNIIVLLAFGVVPHWKIVFFPFLILPLFFLGAGIGLITSVISVVAMDLEKGITIVMGLLMYITPVVYSPKFNNQVIQNIIIWNPLTYLVSGTRDMIIRGNLEHPDRFLYASIFALIFFLFAWRLFFISEDKVIEKMI